MMTRNGALIVVAILVMGSATASGMGTWRWLQRTTVAPGRVTRLNAGGSHPQIEFTTASGQKVDYAQGGLTGQWRVGDVVQVRYDPAVPDHAPCVDLTTAIWTVPIGLLFAGMVATGALIAVSAGWLVKMR